MDSNRKYSLEGAKYSVFITFFLFVCTPNYGQVSFGLPKNVKRECISFKMINNLMVIPVAINGVMGNFILDTGVTTTILFKSHSQAIKSYEDVKEVSLSGFGMLEPIPAIISYNNHVKCKRIEGRGHKVLLLLDEKINFSAKLGMTINGIIGHDFFKNAVVKIDYFFKNITVYSADNFKKKTGSSYTTLPLEFYKFKPYINGKLQIDEHSNEIPIKLLIDSGGSEAFWLFDQPDKGIIKPENSFKDFLGDGITGAIYGDKARIHKIQFGNYAFEQPVISILPKETTQLARRFSERNGSVGAAFLRRFTVWINYKGQEITFKKNNHYKDPFTYNMSGMEIVYNGDILVAQSQSETYNVGQETNKIEFNSSYKFVLKPSYQISHIRPGSPSDLCGLKEGDNVVKINNKASHQMSIDHISSMFREKRGKKVEIVVDRNGETLEFQFKLLDILAAKE